VLFNDRVVIGRNDNILIIDTDNVKPATMNLNHVPEEDMDNFSKERDTVVYAVKSYVVSEAQLMLKEPKENLQQAPQAVLGTGTASEVSTFFNKISKTDTFGEILSANHVL
jgi:tRNA A58 N-methylase Trm61